MRDPFARSTPPQGKIEFRNQFLGKRVSYLILDATFRTNSWVPPAASEQNTSPVETQSVNLICFDEPSQGKFSSSVFYSVYSQMLKYRIKFIWLSNHRNVQLVKNLQGCDPNVSEKCPLKNRKHLGKMFLNVSVLANVSVQPQVGSGRSRLIQLLL